jgi:alanine-glyoxylate transaminase/serine-glyoxylate transaminase/serine-pyruvate transaminase
MSERDLLMIPGPIEIEPAVIEALGRKTLSHLDPQFIETFGKLLEQLRDVFGAPECTPMVVAGGGTLAMELAAANVLDAGDDVLVYNTGYFSDRMARVAERLGARVDHARAALGEAPSLDVLGAMLTKKRYKAVTITHVDTSTGVLAPVRQVAAMAKKAGCLTIVDAVCSVGGEELHQASWQIDVALAASQKALGGPPGLAIALFSPAAIEARKAKLVAPASLYLDLEEWGPILSSYEARKPGYFSTPPVNLINALAVSTELLLAEGMSARVARHRWISHAFRAAWQALGLASFSVDPAATAHTLSALRYPVGVDASLVTAIRDEGVVVAGGLHPDAKAKYFRVGHMGSVRAGDVLCTVGAIERALVRVGYLGFERGAGLAAADKVLGGQLPHS